MTYFQGIFAPWKIVAWGFAGIVNDMIFVYNVLMLLVWFGLNILNCFAWVVIYSVYLEFGDLSKIQDLARLKVIRLKYYQHLSLGIIYFKIATYNADDILYLPIDGHNE